MKIKRPYTIAWLSWLAAFLVIEGAAVFDAGSGDTLSEHVWYVLDQSDVWYYLLGAFLTWLVVHFLARK